MNWKKLVELLAKQGLDAKSATPESVKAFITEKNLELVGADGNAIDVDKLYKAATKKTVVLPDDDDNDADGDVEPPALIEANALVSDLKDAIKSVRGTKAPGFVPVGVTPQPSGKMVAFDDNDKALAFGTYLKAIAFKGKINNRDEAILTKANITTTNSSGGALVPDIFQADIVRLLETRGAAAKYMTALPMQNDKLIWPRQTGIQTVSYPGEGTAPSETNASYNNITLTANKMSVLTRVSRELVNDSVIPIANQVALNFAYAFADGEDKEVFNGDGSSTYGGRTGFRSALTGLSGTIANIAGLTVGTGNAYSELTIGDFQNVAGNLPDYASTSPDVAWYCSRKFYFSTMVRVALAQGGSTAAEAIQTAYGMNPMFLGYPVRFVQVMPSVEANSQVCALFGSLNLAGKIGRVQGGMEILTSEHESITSGLVTFVGFNRFAFAAHDVGNASATATSRVPGPLVGLITAAS